MRRRYDGGVNTTAETVRVGVLGPLAVTDAAGRPVRVGGQRVRALLAVLALAAGRPVPAHALIERLWPEPDDRPVDAVNALQSLVSRLRAALRQGGVAESVLESSPAGYRLAVPPEAVDAAVFEAAARAGGRALAAGDAATAARAAPRGPRHVARSRPRRRGGRGVRGRARGHGSRSCGPPRCSTGSRPTWRSARRSR